MRAWNWSWYTVRLDHYKLMRLRLRIYCARGWEVTLARSLRLDAKEHGMAFSCRTGRAGRLDVRRAPSVVYALRRLGPDEALATALDEYGAAVALCRRGQPVAPDLAQRLARACRRVMALFPHPPGTVVRIDARDRE